MNSELPNKLIDEIDEQSRVFEQALDPVFRRRTGSYYTSMALTIPMVQELINELPHDKQQRMHTLRFLEPCVGTGNFVFAYILLVAKYIRVVHIRTLLDNIYVCDSNTAALHMYRTRLTQLAESRYGLRLGDDYFLTHMGSGLLFDVTSEHPRYIPISELFGEDATNSFDIVVTNPPYKNLKAEQSHYASSQAKQVDKQRYESIGNTAKQVLPLSAVGTINIYKLFVEEIITRYAAPDALVSLLVPSSILTDKTCETLRKSMIEQYHIVSVKNIAENNRFIRAQQALSAILIDKKSAQHDKRRTKICKMYDNQAEEPVQIYLPEFATKENGHTILALNKEELAILQKMMAFPKVKDLACIVNLRGELDITLHKQYITDKKTANKLLRGRNIGYYQTIGTDALEYVQESFVQSSTKRHYIQQSRLACQQIANVAKEQRLNFAMIQPGYVLANSCNFIAVADNPYGIDSYYLAGLLNSRLMNWFFKIHSSNNHINNYEIDNFPIPTDKQLIRKIAALAKSVSSAADEQILGAIDALVARAFGVEANDDDREVPRTVEDASDGIEERAFADFHSVLPHVQRDEITPLLLGKQDLDAAIVRSTPALTDFDRKVVTGMIAKYTNLAAGTLLNHTTFKLSDLDMEMIRPIPQGGNWKYIPAETVSKSRRLKRITETGGRTTLYGRLHYQKPSYTITTYFNRPGNGTYVHPVHDRVLSVREAARLQSFPDDYYFYGNKTQLLHQIGNAVPSLLAYQIGKKMADTFGVMKSVDLFCGAGGLTNGLSQAGIQTVLCTDFNEAACVTVKLNNPEAQVICGDITDSAVRSAINEAAQESGADIVCGGPPCQGFSMAGYRDEHDPRNQLFKEFVAVVASVRPKVVLFENVEGILTFQGGETYRAIHQLFAELGYNTEGRLLRSDRYGVPQKRKRVIIICTRNDLAIDPAVLYPDEVTPDDTQKVTVADAMYDLESIPCKEDASYSNNQLQRSDYNRYLAGEMSAEAFLKLHMAHNAIGADGQLALFSQ